MPPHPPPHGTRGAWMTIWKEPLLVMLITCVITIFSIFMLAAAKIACEVRAEISVFWAILYTTALTIVSLMYLTVFVAYYRQLSKHGSASAINFSLGVAWAIALVAEGLDPNNTWPNKLEKLKKSGRHGESTLNFKARIGLTGITAFSLLAMSLVGGLRVMGIGRRERQTTAGVELDERPSLDDAERPQSPPPSPSRSKFMVVLARIGIVKDRSMTTERAI